MIISESFKKSVKEQTDVLSKREQTIASLRSEK